MLPKTTTIDGGHHHHHHVIVGDVLLHSEAKATTIQVIVRSLTAATPLLGLEKPTIRRLFPSTTASTNLHASAPCDLKNPTLSTGTNSRPLSSKKVLHMPRVGWALAKEFKSKIIATGSSGTKTKVVNISGDSERTHF